MERASATPRQADLRIVAGRSAKRWPVLRQIYDKMADPSGDISMGMCRHLFLFFLQIFSRER
jgi:NADH-quinone oxidoreductase subunit B